MSDLLNRPRSTFRESTTGTEQDSICGACNHGCLDPQPKAAECNGHAKGWALVGQVVVAWMVPLCVLCFTVGLLAARIGELSALGVGLFACLIWLPLAHQITRQSLQERQRK